MRLQESCNAFLCHKFIELLWMQKLSTLLFFVTAKNSAVVLEGRSMAKDDHYYLLKTTYGIHNIILQLCKKVTIRKTQAPSREALFRKV